MSRRMLMTLIIAMALVMGGLVFVQLRLIGEASDIKEEQFDSAAKGALSQVIRRIEDYETVAILEQEFQKQQERLFGSFGIPSFNNFPRNLSQQDISIQFSISGQVYSNFQENYSYSNKDSIALRENTRGRPGDFPSGFDMYLDNYNRRQQERVKQMMADRENQLQKIFWRDRPIEERIDSIFIRDALKREFANAGIDLDYKFAVKAYAKGEEKEILGDNDYKPGNKSKQYFGVLFPGDHNMKPNYLYVYFPKRSRYLIERSGILVIPTIILAALLIGIFVYTILIILRQKKLSIIKNDFINNMTHELKTPISTISLASQMLEDRSVANTPTTIEHISKVINQESKRLSFQVEKVLQMAVFNEGRLKLRFKEIDINRLVTNVISNFELKVKSKGGTLTSELSANLTEIKGDEVHITNVIFNLLDNAVKYSKEIPEIHISTENRKDFVVVAVKDNGIGIPKEHQAQIFERFYRVPTGNVHNVKGFGLGLSYVKKIVDIHNGKIKVESNLNKGTMFSLFFPLNNK